MDFIDLPSDVDYYLMLNGISKHGDEVAPPPEGWTERNAGIGFGFEFGEKLIKSAGAGAFNNSYDNTTSYLGVGLKQRFGRQFYVDVGAMTGLMFGGYENQYINMFLTPTITIGEKDIGAINIIYAYETVIAPSFWAINLQISL